jgi:hypothetical protein
MGSLQYEFEWNHGREKEHSLLCGPKPSMEDKRVVVELWKAKVPLKRIREQLQDSKATSLPQLQQEIKFLWTLQMDDIQYLKNLVESMPRRLEAVILNVGNSTKY